MVVYLLVLEARGTEDRVLSGDVVCDRVGLDGLRKPLNRCCFVERNIRYLAIRISESAKHSAITDPKTPTSSKKLTARQYSHWNLVPLFLSKIRFDLRPH